jgi:hypothetical protein
MALLAGVSLMSWYYIFMKLFAVKQAREKTENFERDFWSGGDLNNLFNSAVNDRHHAGSMERIFDLAALVLQCEKLAHHTVAIYGTPFTDFSIKHDDSLAITFYYIAKFLFHALKFFANIGTFFELSKSWFYGGVHGRYGGVRGRYHKITISFFADFFRTLQNQNYINMVKSNIDKKSIAKDLFIKSRCTQEEIAEKVGTTRQTVSRWIRFGKYGVSRLLY